MDDLKVNFKVFSIGNASNSQSHVFFNLLRVVKITNDGSKGLYDLLLEVLIMTLRVNHAPVKCKSKFISFLAVLLLVVWIS